MGNALVQWLLDSGSGIGRLRTGVVFLGKMLCEKIKNISRHLRKNGNGQPSKLRGETYD